MTNTEREFFISRICAGYIKCTVNSYDFKIYPPTDSIIYEANELAMDIIDSSEGLSEEEVMFFLVENNDWDLTKENTLKELPEKIEDLKVKMYESTFKSNLREILRKELRKCELEYDSLSDIKSRYFYLTNQGIALSAKSYYIIENCTFLNGEKYNWSQVPIINVINKYNSLLLNDMQLRELARTEPWISIWSMKKINGTIFSEPFSNEQRQLVLYSKFYDSVYESHERPSQEVINDDDLLDGWLISNRRKNQSNCDENFTTNEKIANADEIFIVAETVKDIEKVNKMNDAYGNSVKKRRLKTLESRGEVSWMEFADMKEKLGIAAAKEMRERFK